MLSINFVFMLNTDYNWSLCGSDLILDIIYEVISAIRSIKVAQKQSPAAYVVMEVYIAMQKR
jgi:hypothetical protein